MQADPVEDGLKALGVSVEKREDLSPTTQMIAIGLGSILGSYGGALMGFGLIGRALVSLAGAAAAQVAVTYRIGPREDQGDQPEEGPSSPRRGCYL
jgi:hypothetical protein